VKKPTVNIAVFERALEGFSHSVTMRLVDESVSHPLLGIDRHTA